MKKQTNPLLLQNLTQAEQRLVEAYAMSVKEHWHEMRALDESLYLGFEIKNFLKGHHYDVVYEANQMLRRRDYIMEHHEMGGITGLINGFRMGEGDGKIIVSIPKDMVKHYRELAELPYMRFAVKFKSDYDRSLYLLNDAIADILDTTVKHTIVVNGIKLNLEPSQAMGKGWLHLKLEPGLVNLLGINGNSYFKKDGEYFFGEIKRSILKPRFLFLSGNTDLRCELHNAQGPVKVTGIDIRSTRQAVDAGGVSYSSLTEYQLCAQLERIFSEKRVSEKVAAALNSHESIKLYITAIASGELTHKGETFSRDKRPLNDWATLIVAAQYPEFGITHKEISAFKRKLEFEKFKKEIAAA